MVDVDADTATHPSDSVTMGRRAWGLVSLIGVAVAAALGVVALREAESTGGDGESTAALDEPVVTVQAASAPPAVSTIPAHEAAVPIATTPATNVPETTTPATNAATKVPETATPATNPATTVPETTAPAAATAMTVPADRRDVTIHQRVASCRFGHRCLVVGFTIDGFDDHPGTFVCEFASGGRYTMSFTTTTVDYACATANASDSITIEIDGVRASTMTPA